MGENTPRGTQEEKIMADLTGREHRLLDLSTWRDNRYKGAGIHVSEEKQARCSAVFCEWIINTNTELGGKSPFPYGLYILNGQADELSNPPQELLNAGFLEVIPCDRPDRRAARLSWNETGTEATFSFAALASLVGINWPKGSTLWIDAIMVNATNEMPVAALPLGGRIETQAVRETAAGKQGNTPK